MGIIVEPLIDMRYMVWIYTHGWLKREHEYQKDGLTLDEALAHATYIRRQSEELHRIQVRLQPMQLTDFRYFQPVVYAHTSGDSLMIVRTK